MTDEPSSDRLQQLIDDWCDGTIASADAEQLNQLLADDETARRQFLRCTELHGLLLVGDAALSAAPHQPSLAPARRKLPAWLAAGSRFLARPRNLSLSVAALVIAVIVTVMAVVAPPFFHSAATNDDEVQPPPVAIVAQITDMHEAVWPPGQVGVQRGARLPSGRWMELQSGFVELTFRDGARVLLEGPASFEAQSSSAGVLSHGKLTADIGAAQSQRLTINTPHAQIVDLGTQFGVAVDQTAIDVVVFAGRVEVAPQRDGVPTATRRSLGAGESLRIQAGQVVAADAGEAAAQFVRGIESVGPAIAALRANSGRRYLIANSRLDEDAVSHADRAYQWNGATDAGLPPYLVGAQYVQTAMDDKLNRELAVLVKLRRSATMYLFISTLGDVPDWVQTDFENTGDQVGLDTDVQGTSLGIGPGDSVDQTYDVWRREVSAGQVVILGPPQDGQDGQIGTYGIAVVAQ